MVGVSVSWQPILLICTNNHISKKQPKIAFVLLLLSMIPLPGFFGYCDVQMAEGVHSRHPFVLGGSGAKKALHARYPADAIIGPCQPCLQALPPAIGQVANTRTRTCQPDWSQTLIQVPRTCACPKMLTCLIILCGPGPNIGRDIWVAM